MQLPETKNVQRWLVSIMSAKGLKEGKEGQESFKKEVELDLK